MKNLLFTLFIFLVLSTITSGQVRTGEKKMTINKETGDTTYTESVIISESEDITVRNHMIVINPLKFFFFYNISYFYKISESTVVGGGIQTPTFDHLSGIGVNIEARFHPKGKNMRGFYFAPNFSYSSLSSKYSTRGDVFSIGGLLGWQWFPGDEFAIGLGIGIDYYIETEDDGYNSFGNFEGTTPAVRFDVGYAW